MEAIVEANGPSVIDTRPVTLPDRAEVVVVGLGLMGSAATWSLARRGHTVVGLDASPAGHRRGSSHGSSRIFRLAYAEPDYVAMARSALGLWRDLEAEASQALLTQSGALNHGPDADVHSLARVLAASSVEAELLEAGEAAGRWPHLHFEGPVVYHPEAGVIDPEATMAALLRLAAGRGARVFRETPVRSVRPQGTGVRLELAGGSLQADTVVVAAGPWIPSLLHDVVPLPPLTVSQQSVFHFARRAGHEGEPWPAVTHDGDGMTYGLPGGRDGAVPGNIKLGQHAVGGATTANGRDGVVDPQARRWMIDYVQRWWPGLAPEPVAEYSCLYTLTPNDDFFIERRGPLVVCSACSGHGAKFTPLIGEWLADLVEGRPLPLARFGALHHGLA
jgi:monomeric sarcosine oxidase